LLAPQVVEEIERKLGPALKSLVLFGSATRPEDYMVGLSDVNVAVLLEGSVSVEELVDIEDSYKISVEPLTPAILQDLASRGAILAFYLKYDSKALLDDGTFSAFLEDVPVRPTKETYDDLEKISLFCLETSIEKYFEGKYHRTFYYLYKSLKNALVLQGLAERGVFTVKNEKLMEGFERSKEKSLFKSLVLSCKQLACDKQLAWKVVDQVIDALSSLLSKEIPRFSNVIAALSSKYKNPTPELVALRFRGGSAVWIVELAHEGGFARVACNHEIEEVGIEDVHLE